MCIMVVLTHIPCTLRAALQQSCSYGLSVDIWQQCGGKSNAPPSLSAEQAPKQWACCNVDTFECVEMHEWWVPVLLGLCCCIDVARDSSSREACAVCAG